MSPNGPPHLLCGSQVTPQVSLRVHRCIMAPPSGQSDDLHRCDMRQRHRCGTNTHLSVTRDASQIQPCDLFIKPDVLSFPRGEITSPGTSNSKAARPTKPPLDQILESDWMKEFSSSGTSTETCMFSLRQLPNGGSQGSRVGGQPGVML